MSGQSDAILAFVGGIGSSAAVWWLTARLLRPRIVFGDGISRRPKPDIPAGHTYRARIMNFGFRAAVDVSVDVLLVYKLPDGSSDLQQILRLSHYSKSISWMYPRKLKKVFSGRPYGGNRAFQIQAQETKEFLRRTHMPKSIHDGVRDKTLTLDHVLEVLPGAYIRIYVSAWDNFSGARRTFRSPKLRANDVVEGKWEGDRIRPDSVPPVGEPVPGDEVRGEEAQDEQPDTAHAIPGSSVAQVAHDSIGDGS